MESCCFKVTPTLQLLREEWQMEHPFKFIWLSQPWYCILLPFLQPFYRVVTAQLLHPIQNATMTLCRRCSSDTTVRLSGQQVPTQTTQAPFNSRHRAGSSGQFMQHQRRADWQVWFHGGDNCRQDEIWSCFTPVGLIELRYPLFISICFSAVLAPHFSSLPRVALAATYHIPHLEREPFMMEGEMAPRMRSKRPPSELQSKFWWRCCVKGQKLSSVCHSDKGNVLMRSACHSHAHLSFETWRSVLLN